MTTAFKEMFCFLQEAADFWCVKKKNLCWGFEDSLPKVQDEGQLWFGLYLPPAELLGEVKAAEPCMNRAGEWQAHSWIADTRVHPVHSEQSGKIAWLWSFVPGAVKYSQSGIVDILENSELESAWRKTTSLM